ncbi:MAG TPA: benzoate-CoA ligase family protein [Pyrinomonadaceae bacterium]|nr:benzoate-CoA ligase family protein [Pyrinomonadaceae bacterium]
MNPDFPEHFNMADYFLYHNLEEGREHKVCLYFEDQTYTYGDTARRSNRVGNALRELGAEMEDRVLIVLPDCPEFVWTWFGAARIGAIISMVNPLLPAADYKYYLEYTRARVAIVHESLLNTFNQAAADARYLRAVLVVGAAGASPLPDCPVPTSIGNASQISFATITQSQSDECAAADTHRDDIAIWLFSSGSTGNPKGAVHLQHDLPFNTEVFAKRTMGVNENDLTVSVPKLFFGYATGTNLLFPFAVGGATALFAERSTAEKLFEVIERYRPTILTTVPTMINAMLNAPDAARRDLSSLRFCYSAGEALPVELYERWNTSLGVEICDGIGSAEMFHIYISNRPGDVKPGSLGRIVEGYEAKIVNAEGNEVSTNEMGTLKIKGDSAALCYWNSHEKSKQTFAGDWCTTGDQFHVDEEGYYWYHGRTDDMLKVSGIFVAPVEIENCLLQHEAVLECAVIGAKADDGLVKPKAFIVLREEFAAVQSPTSNVQRPNSSRSTSEQSAGAANTLADELKNFVKSHLAPYKYPRWIEFVPSLPKNDRGKIDRKKLKEAQVHSQPAEQATA